MRRRVLRIRRWLVLAVAVASLGLATGGGFDWADATVGIGIGFSIALGGLAAVQSTRKRRRLATLL